MIHAWLELPPLAIFATLIVVYFGTVALLGALNWRSPRTVFFRSLIGLTPPFFGALAVLFALLISFLSSDIGERNRLANRAVQVEAGEMRNIHTLSVASASDMRTIRAALKDYIASVLHDEWPAMAANATSPRTDTAFDHLLREISDPQIALASGQAVHAALINAAIRAGTARSERLALAGDRTNTLKWASVLILGLMTLIAIALVHVGHPWRAFITALVVFSSAAVVVIGLVAVQEDPFNGVFRISPVPIERLQSLSVTVTPPDTPAR
ncbi:MAG: hypothetical protein DCC74_08490 [Proteobacteria bacterium]|nr:MAG: hypothetical protein DCC74_08490 [Pseudomonadota bacterium]